MSDTPLMDAALTGYKLDPARWKELRPMPRKLYRRGREIEIRMNKAERRVAELELAASELLAAIQSVEPDVEISPREAVAIMAMKDVLNKSAAKRQEGE